MKSKKNLQPTYYDQFVCNPVKCEETCCARWQIDIDRETCLKYKNCDNTQLQELAKESILIHSNALGEDDFARIKLQKDMTCPFLNKYQLCQIVLGLGDDALSKTCNTFPRTIKVYQDSVEQGLVMSCSVACELALQNPSGIELEEKSSDLDLSHLHFQDMESVSKSDLKEFRELRSEMIGIMKNRKWDLCERMFRIGALFQPKEMRKMPRGVAQEQFNHLNQLLSLKFNQGDTVRFFSNRYIACLMEILDTFGSVEETKQGSFFQMAEEKYAKSLFQEKGYLFENYWVNYLFIFGEDFLVKESRWRAYQKMALYFSLMRFNVMGLAVSHKGLSEKWILKLIQSMEKTFVPDQQYFESSMDYLEKNRLNNGAGIASLLTNYYK